LVRVREHAHEELAIAAVGATLVGKVRVTCDDSLTTNTGDRAARWRQYDPPPRWTKGQEWGRFEFGSTLVLAAAPGALELAPRPPGTLLRLGTRIGTLGEVPGQRAGGSSSS
jgi:phosphatidylserine decarboxylase